MKHFKVWVSDNASVWVWANSKHEAKEKVWNEDLKNGYQYGWKSKQEFINNAKVEEER